MLALVIHAGYEDTDKAEKCTARVIINIHQCFT